MAAVTAQQVADFLGQGDDTTVVTLAGEHLPIVTAFVKAYTRGRGFDLVTGHPADDLAAVIVTATARLVVNPEQAQREQVGSWSVQYPTLHGWTLPELAVLNTYRRRTA